MRPDVAAARVDVDRLLTRARAARVQNDWPASQELMLQAATALQKIGYDTDQVKVLREMTLEPNNAYAAAGARALAEFYHKRYLKQRPRKADWLLEAIAWAHYARADDLVSRYVATARPDTAHAGIAERGKQRGDELRADDQLYLAGEDIRLNRQTELEARLKDWPWDINRLHSLQGTSLLHVAVWYRKADTVKLLVEKYQANVNVVDRENDTPLDYAYHQREDGIATYLKGRGGKPNNTYHVPKANAQPTLDELKKLNPSVLAPPEPKKPARPVAPPVAPPAAVPIR